MIRILSVTLLTLLLLSFISPLSATDLPRVRILISNPAPYVGEELIVTMEVRTAPWPQSAIAPIWPNLDSCATSELQTPPPRLEDEGKPVLVQLMQRSIRPLHSGRLPLISAGVSIGGKNYYAPAIELRVLQLPEEGRPDDFAGAIGQIKIQLESEGTGNREIRLILEGHASLETFPPPKADLQSGERLILIDDATVGVPPQARTRTLRYLYLPGDNEKGRLAFRLSVFDPYKHDYVVHTAAIRLIPIWVMRTLYLLFAIISAVYLVRYYRIKRTPRTVEEALEQILGLNPQQLFRADIVDFLKSCGASPSLLRNLAAHWQARDQRSYAPHEFRPKELTQEDLEQSQELLLQLIRMKSWLRWLLTAVEKAVTDQLRARMAKLSM